MALDKFSGTDPDQDAQAFIRLTECKINFALGTEPDEADAEHDIYIQKESFILPNAKRTRSRMVWQHYPRRDDLKCGPNSVLNQIFRWKEQIQTQKGS